MTIWKKTTLWRRVKNWKSTIFWSSKLVSDSKSYFEAWILYVNERAFHNYSEITMGHLVALWSIFFVKMQKFQFWPDLKKRSRAPPGGPRWTHNIFQMHVYWRTIFIPRNSPRCHWPIFRVKKWSKSKSGASSINQRLFTDDVIYDVNFSLSVTNTHSVWIWQWI